MSLVIAGVVAYGFSRTVDAGLIHPAYPIPSVLYVHAAVFGGWIVLFVIQSALIGVRNVRLHRKIGVAGAALGSAIPVVGVATAVAMGRIHTQLGSTDEAAFLALPFYEMIAFAIPFGLAILWRRKPEYHRRLMLIATCTLTVAAFNRFPASLVPPNWAFAGVDLLIVIGAGRDLMVARDIHPTYLYGLPLIVLGQAMATYTYLNSLPSWVKFAQKFVE